MRGFGIDDISWYCIVLLVLSSILSATLESENGLLVPEFQALKINSFAKNHENNDGHAGLPEDMIVDPEVVLQSADRKDDKDGDWWFSINHRIIQ